jgi:hypothetical protein
MRTIKLYRQELNASQVQLKQLNDRGVKVLSRYDIETASGGDAELALQTAKRLVSNHIKYYQRLIAEMEKEPKQLELL